MWEEPPGGCRCIGVGAGARWGGGRGGAAEAEAEYSLRSGCCRVQSRLKSASYGSSTLAER